MFPDGERMPGIGFGVAAVPAEARPDAMTAAVRRRRERFTGWSEIVPLISRFR
jgi:hypothetical protein